MNATEMIELRSRKPFVPFEIRLRDGSSIRVEQPYVVSTRPDSPSCVVHENEHMHIVAYRDITDVIAAPVNGSQQETP